jgi:hypothetical protein
MKKKGIDKKVEEIIVLDKGRNMDDLDILQFFCCTGTALPYRAT